MTTEQLIASANTTVSPASLALRDSAATRPQDAAIEIDGVVVSFAQYNEQADSLAAWLLAEGATEGDRIALRTSGTHATAVGFIAIMRAGMVSVPIDPTAPIDRARQIIGDVDAALLMSDVDGDEELPAFAGHPLTLGADMDPTPIDRGRGELVSIVYTSGSTGTPKGIMVGRDQVDHMLGNIRTFGAPAATGAAGLWIGMPDGQRMGGLVAGTTGYIERLLLAALMLRGPLVAYEIRRHGIAPLGAWLERERIVSFSTVPTVLRHLLSTLEPEQQFPDLRRLVLSGERLTWEDVTRLRQHVPAEVTIVNAFGLTEAATIATFVITDDVPAGEGALPAGTLAADVKLTLVDENGEPVAAGESGEIVVEGPGCALGYWRRPDLTESVFTVMPSGYRRVRTGDGGRIRPDGMLEHLGRLDHVVKISGMRTELGEVEHALARLDGVTAAAVATYLDDTESTRLTAAVVASPGATLDARVLRAALSRRLPGYMIPDHIAVVDALPQLIGGKTDRAAVAALRTMEPAAPAEQSRALSELEATLSKIWCDVLGVKSVGVDDDFVQLGGDSIRAARVFVELESRIGIDRPMSLLAEAPTIASLAIALGDDSTWSELLAVQTSGSRPPLFVVHDGTGSLGAGRAMAAALGPDQPLYGIRCEGLSGAPLRAESLEDLAATYVERVKRLYPHGPYVFYGASLGGVIAIEMARQLKSAGDDVPLVILGDSIAPRDSLTLRGAPVGERGKSRLRELRALPLSDRPGRLLWLAERQIAHRIERSSAEAREERRLHRMMIRALERGEPVPVEARGRKVMRDYGGLLHNYRAQPPYPERVLLLRTGGPGDVPDRGWGEIVGDALQIIDVPGSHPDLGREASSAYVGPVLAEALSQIP
jgi:acyl-coenzyme A synthetase/AMP-(fatty) acid ligase/thioesterase domain-containing protein/acyl carrier protein